MYVKKLRYFTINECLDKLGFDELTQLSDSITSLLLIRQNEAKQAYLSIVEALIPECYNDKNRDWNIDWVEDKSIITWNTPNCFIKIDKTEFDILIENISIKVIYNNDKHNIISDIDLNSAINVINKDIKTVNEWVYFIISVYDKLLIHYDKLYDMYYRTLNLY